MNGPISIGRPVGGLAAGRAVGPLVGSWAGGGFCPPVPQCCCVGPWTIKPGETQPLVLQWQRWIDSVPGYIVNKVTSADLYDMTVNPPGPADPELIWLETDAEDENSDSNGGNDDIDNPNVDVAGAINIQPPYVTHTRVSVALEAPIGKQFRLNLAVTARDCDGRKITMRDCVVIVVSEC